MIKIGICDDEQHELKRTHELLIKYIRDYAHMDVSVLTFHAPLELLSHVEVHGGFDILILDVYMAGILGTEVARELRGLGDQGEIIFITSSRAHAIEAFEVDAAQYLVKPYEESVFFAAIEKVMKNLIKDRRVVVTLKTTDGVMRLPIRDVVFTETGRNNYQIIHTIQGKKLEVRMTATEIFELLSQNKFFVRCGASINVNLKFVRQIARERITFDTGDQITYPYRAYQALKDAFLSFQMTSD